MSKPIDVAVALIQDNDGKVLITQRSDQVAHAGCWEFPGGKFEPLETPVEALRREVLEEVNLEVQQSHFVEKIEHTYPEKSVCLHIFEVREFRGQAQICDGQKNLLWVMPSELKSFTFPEANQRIIHHLCASSSSELSH